jgi:GNAT superfamily N-acetyltransferase
MSDEVLSKIRVAKPGDELGIHDSHMRSIREVCVRAHGEEEVRGWGNRPLGERWIVPIRDGYVWVVELEGTIRGSAYIRVQQEPGETKAHIFGLYLTPEVISKGVGAKTMQLMLDKAKSSGAREVTLDSTLTGHEFYKRFGFLDAGPMKWTEIGGSMVRCFPMVLVL